MLLFEMPHRVALGVPLAIEGIIWEMKMGDVTRFWLVAVMVLVPLIASYGSKATAQEEIACGRNLHSIAVLLECYKTDCGNYPDRLGKRGSVVCGPYLYRVSPGGSSYTLTCVSGKHSRQGFPKYGSEDGLLYGRGRLHDARSKRGAE